MIPELRDLSYEIGLLECGLTTLETKVLRGTTRYYEVLRGEQIEVFKIVEWLV